MGCKIHTYRAFLDTGWYIRDASEAFGVKSKILVKHDDMDQRSIEQTNLLCMSKDSYIQCQPNMYARRSNMYSSVASYTNPPSHIFCPLSFSSNPNPNPSHFMLIHSSKSQQVAPTTASYHSW